ncbi:MAG TPA: segregation/condensation protein A [Kiritimatiellia bacterium]|mgnify:FL=1|nr:MAG: Segregation and condensation protein A [Verrucomicrobia bacterium ADurb.Bin070]HPO37006.1 segregation/condensation protein A [Kiritimatiellia bacterium]HQL50202.1 segregation/condensation protein A [Kiritimatiellia bacterium]HQQ91227.1 segregation/condensation protein A [Kiritimatiellia bacterium]
MALDALLTDDYKVDLEVFEGPLDLLLYLIRREEVDIYDIPIERITAQYMAYLDVMRMLDLNIAGEFLVMAATLMMIKSRMLLPVESRAADEPSEEAWIDPRLDLVRQLVEYKKFKDAADRLLELETLQSEAFAFGGDKPVFEKDEADAGQALGDIGLFDLLTAFQEVLARAPMEPLGHLEPIRWSVPDKMEAIGAMVRDGHRLEFSKLFNPESHRNEVIVTFLALLELLRLRQIVIHQNAAFHEILILPVEDAAGEPLSPPVIGGGEHVES